VVKRVLALSGATVAALTGQSTTTTTTTVPVSSSEETSAPWGWIIADLLVWALAALVVILVNRRNRQRALRAWRDQTRETLGPDRRPGHRERPGREGYLKGRAQVIKWPAVRHGTGDWTVYSSGAYR
jgi:hypothetical protein